MFRNGKIISGKIAKVNMSLPSPSVSVEEVTRVGERTTQITEEAKF